MGFFLFIKKEEEEEELGSDIHIVWKKKSHELVRWIAFMGQNQAFFVSLSLSLTVCFFWVQNWIWSSIHMLDTGGVIKDWVWVLGLLWSLKTERTEHECVYTWMSPQYCFFCYYSTTIALLLLCYAGSLSQSACAKIMLWLWLIFLYSTLRLKLLDF